MTVILLAAAAPADARDLVHEAVIPAPVEAVWDAFTTSEGFASWAVAQCEMNLRIGGEVRSSYNPQSTLDDEFTIVNRIISYEPQRMLSIQNVRAPAAFANAHLFQQTWSVIYFELAGKDQTRVRTVGLGYGEGQDWDEIYEKFKLGNAITLDRLQKHFAPEQEAEADPAATNETYQAIERRFHGQKADAKDADSYRSYLAHIAAADGALRLSEIGPARRWLDAAPIEHRGWEWRYLQTRSDTSPRAVVAHDEVITAIAVSPDGLHIATASADHTAKILAAATDETLATLAGHSAAIFDVEFSPDGSRVATSSRDRTIRIWDVRSFEPLLTITDANSHIMGLTFSPDGTRIAGTLLSYAKVWDTTTGELALTLKGHVEKPPVVAVDWSSDGSKIVTGSWDNWAIIWDASTGEVLHKLGPGYGTDDYVQFKSVQFSADDSMVIAAGSDGSCRIWDVASGDELAHIDAHPVDCFNASISPNGRVIATAGQDGLIKLWNFASRSELATLRGNTAAVRGLAFSTDGATLISAADDGSVRFWPADPKRHRSSFAAHDDGPWDIAFSPDGRTLLTAGDKDLKLWDRQSLELKSTVRGHDEAVTAVACSPDGSRAATGSNDRTVRVWNLATGEAVFVSETLRGQVHDIAWSPDGRFIAACAPGREVRLWDASTFKPAAEIVAEQPNRVAFSPDSATLAIACRNGSLHLVSMASPAERTTIQVGEDGLNECVFSADGALLAVCVDDRTVRLWDIAARRELLIMRGHAAPAYDIAFLDDGARLATAGYDSTVRIWDAATGENVLTMPSPEWVWGLAASPDGQTIAWGPVNGTIELSAAGR